MSKLLLAVALVATLAGAGGATAQTTRTVKIVVPFAAGGPTDVIARMLGEQVSRAQGLAVVIENRPGAGSIIGTEAVSRAAPDGKTILMVANSFIINQHLRNLNYDTLTSFEPICHLVSSSLVLAVDNSSPYRTLVDLLNAARARPGDLTLASAGPATANHIGFEMLKRVANVNLTYVPYGGDALAVNALLGGHVTSVFSGYVAVAEQLKAGKLRALAIGSSTRTDELPDVPTISESGYKNYRAETWFGLVAPAKTPTETISQLADWFGVAVRASEMKPKLLTQGLFPEGICGVDFRAHLRSQFDEYGRIIREANIKAE